MNGLLPLWKPRGITSHDCVIKIRRLFGIKKVGHTGTLDPEVEGVLPLCIGNATKVVPYLTALKKTYIAECALGTATETEDAHGAIIEQKEVTKSPSNWDIENVLQTFKGNITQIPPMYSAVKVNGKKLYQYARANEQVERPERPVTIYEIDRLPNNIENKIKLRIVCSQGTYIRTLCVDIGIKLGYPAHMSDLKRIESGSFNIEDAVAFKEIKQAVELNRENELLFPITRGLDHMDRLYVDEDFKKRVLHGQKLSKPKSIKTDPFLIMYHQQLLAIYQIHPENSEQIKPIRVFNG